ncbi:MAG: PAS domain S-box protein [Planctomycetota bacterium]
MDGQSPRTKEKLLDAMLDGLIDAVVVIDAFGRIVRASRSVEDHFGWLPTELKGQNINVLIPEPHHSAHDGYLERFRRTGRTWILGTVREFEVVRKDGVLISCELSVSELKITPEDEAGEGAVREQPLYCGSFRDVTERAQARRALRTSEAKFRAVFEHENQIVLLLDAEGTITEANAPALERIGLESKAVIGQRLEKASLWSAEPGHCQAVARAYSEALREGLGVARADVMVAQERLGAFSRSGPPLGRAVGANGAPFPHEVSIRVLSSADESMPAAIVEVRDVTDLVESERRESAVIRSLARVGEESAVLAHELRSPVSSLELALKAVGRQLGEGENAVLHELAERMRRLEELLTRTLRFSKPLDLELKAIPVAEAFGLALSREAEQARAARIRTKVAVGSGTPPVLADESALGDVLANLVRNAVQAQPEGGAITLQATTLDLRTNRPFVRMTVIDQGPGIPASMRESMFQLFRTEKEDGTGLGLALVRKIAEEHGATVSLESGEGGRGLAVTLDWPAAVFPSKETLP